MLGFDTLISVDHHWGPRLMLFLSDSDYKKYRTKISDVLSKKLPYKFMGYSTNFGHPDEAGVQPLESIDKGFVNHRVEIDTTNQFFNNYLGINPLVK